MQKNDARLNDQAFFGHPKPLQGLFLTELWERFSYYGIRPLLILYMSALTMDGGLGIARDQAAAIVGLFGGCIYLFTLVGGWLSDHWLGQAKAVWYGAMIIALGHFCIALTAWFSSLFFYFGLIFLVIGSGLFKPCISVMVGRLYSSGDPRRDAGFSIFYMGINLGAFFAPLITGLLLQKHGWHIGFGIGGIGMLISLVIFRFKALLEVSDFEGSTHPNSIELQHFSNTMPIKIVMLLGLICIVFVTLSLSLGWIVVNPVEIVQYFAFLILFVVSAYFIYLFMFKGLNSKEKYKLVVCFLLFLAATLFWAVFEQQPTSLNLFALDYTQRHIAGFEVPAVWFQSVNSIFIILLSPLVAWLWIYLARHDREPSYLAKFSLGLVFVALGFSVMILAIEQVLHYGHLVSPFWLIACLLLMTIGELCLSPVGLSAITLLAPEGLSGQMMGIWFTAAAVGNLVAGWIGGHVSGNQLLELPLLFSKCVVILLIGATVIALLAKPMRRLIQDEH